jgi:hypothetical protein
MAENFKIVGQITEIETIAIGSSIRELPELRARFGRGRWRKRKGVADVRLSDGTIRFAEVHWYEAHGIGKVRMKIKRYLD